ncbi:hypothetical protein [Methylobacterium nonmethylotrophicum]|uniref:Exosortase/archaeosortase family protein n=1 Tax=Methylobacterium nonmethylotrophicum TaxID=1141884 RepID=A0A4Z0NHD6_9HYPH|nr:hypothetical protein [Methylobacterium nonmethylotrophicum]TGD94851.1 hypothetical protein EU555_30845 [Methylobacterium nonmethylotrophicum]
MSQATTSPVTGPDRPATAARDPAVLTRGGLFAALFGLGFANGMAQSAAGAIQTSGLAEAVLHTFGVSVLVWVAAWLCPLWMLQSRAQPPARGDLIVAAGAIPAFLLPMAWPSWLALTGVALYLLGAVRPVPGRSPPLRRAAWVLLALTSTLFWGHLLLVVLGEVLLKADAVLVGWLTGSPRSGNTVQFAAGGGYIWIEEGCSSLSGISLVILCWTLFSQARGARWTPAGLSWCALACLVVTLINVSRMGLMVLYRDRYDLLHGPVGAGVAGWLTLAAIVGLCACGARGRGPAHA